MELEITKTYYLANYLGAGSAEVLSGEDLSRNIAGGDWGNEKDWESTEGNEVTAQELFNDLEKHDALIGTKHMSNCGTALLTRIF
tara:strand:- start:459 stop:713 length:255 start_codon:yes stop_codon:yes gene_type:complete